mgnify:CR=1 FL=1
MKIKKSVVTSIQSYYDIQENSGNFYVYPTTQTVTDIIYIEFTKAVDDFTNVTDDFDMPQEWGETIKWNLAYRLGFEYGTPTKRLTMIKAVADETLQLALGYDQENASIYIQPDQWQYNIPTLFPG